MMKKHLVLLLSLCAVSPVVYGMDEHTAGNTATAATPPATVAPATAQTKDQAPATAQTKDQAPATAQTTDQAPATAQTTDQAPATAQTTDQAPATVAPATAQTKDQAPATAQTTDEQRGVLAKAWDKALTPARFVKSLILTAFRTIWHAPELAKTKYHQTSLAKGANAQATFVNDFKLALTEQGNAVRAARRFQAMRAISFGTLAAAIGSGAGFYKFGADFKTAAVGALSGAATGLGAWLFFGHRAQLGEIARRQRVATLHATGDHITAKDAAKAYEDSEKTTGLSKWSLFGRAGLNAMHSMSDKVAANWALLSPETTTEATTDAAAGKTETTTRTATAS